MPGYLGVDIGSQGVKVVQLDNDRGRARLVTYGYEVTPSSGVLSDVTKRDRATTVAALKAVLARARVSTTKAVGALPSFSVFSSMLTLPKLPKQELEEAIRWEAKKVIPLPIEDMILDSKVIDVWGVGDAQHAAASAGVIQEEKKETIHVFVTAAPKTLVEQYVGIFRDVGLELLSLETEILATARALIFGDTAPVMLIDIGASTTTVAVIVDQIPVLSRSIEFGGVKLTAILANRLKVTPVEAEQVKRECSMTNDFSLDPLMSECAPLMTELTYAVQLFERSDLSGFAGTRRIEKAVLTGGGALFPGLVAAVTKSLNLNVILGNPWARVSYPLELESHLQKLAGAFAIPIGLAMREIEVVK